MIRDYVVKLIDNLPNEMKDITNPIKIDLVLDGGIFNGSYLIGALYFLKELENRRYIQIDRISGCSIGAIAAFLYFIDELDKMSSLYEIVFDNFKTKYNLSMLKDMYRLLNIPHDVCKRVNKKMYITYYNIKRNKKIIKNTFKSREHIINTIIKSSFVPYLIDGSILYEKKYIDGINPYIFPLNKDLKNGEKINKVLYLDLFGYDKIGCLLNIRNEKTNFHRILSGLLDIHTFFIKQSQTQMCSYVNDWNITNHIHNIIKKIVEKICVYFIYLLLFAKKYLPRECKSNLFYNLISKIIYDIYITLLETYCF